MQYLQLQIRDSVKWNIVKLCPYDNLWF